jgi:rubrerythrin
MALYSISEIIDIAKQVEHAGEAFYAEALKHVKSTEVRELFTHLHGEEQRHAQLFEDILSEIDGDTGPWRQDDDYLAYMRGLVRKQVFPDPEEVRQAMEELQDEKTALTRAIGFEKDSILFFHELRNVLAVENRGVIDALVDEERKHLQALNTLLDKL